MNQPITLVKISRLTGDLLISDGVFILLFTINGKLLIKKRISQPPKNSISALHFIHYPHSFKDEFYLTGHNDGIIKLWKIHFKQKIINNTNSNNNNNNGSGSGGGGGDEKKNEDFIMRDLILVSQKKVSNSSIVSFATNNAFSELYISDSLNQIFNLI